ncbi:hypothetical protein DPEC_G00355740 [Dallia pectoralis]|uniref:Uncharacterized protein n=1 Tax=Dallia pectoralis TaxID=75939 RepID=A0ACC2EZJ9_DALPE|nr:hypothetical protein DPEC_G00355740 [Dallia pectoralis]
MSSDAYSVLIKAVRPGVGQSGRTGPVARQLLSAPGPLLDSHPDRPLGEAGKVPGTARCLQAWHACRCLNRSGSTLGTRRMHSNDSSALAPLAQLAQPGTSLAQTRRWKWREATKTGSLLRHR